MKTLGLIPARGGSKGIPGKNVRLLAGRPLLAYTADCARAAKSLDRIVLSTDDPAIAEVGRKLGLDVPFLRPADLAQDDTPTLPVVQHALRALEDGGNRFEAVCLLQPTHPFRRPEHIDACVALLAERGADAVATVTRVPAMHNPHWVYFRGEGGRLRLATGEDAPIPRRQDLPPAFCREGSVYVTKREVVLEQNSLYGGFFLGYVVDGAGSVNLDGLEDWRRAEEYLAAQTGPMV